MTNRGSFGPRFTLEIETMRTETIHSEVARQVYAAERLSAEMALNAQNDEETFEAMEAPEKREAVAAWLDAHPEIVVGVEVVSRRRTEPSSDAPRGTTVCRR